MYRLTCSILALTMVSACTAMPYRPYAREVKKKPADGGVIALKLEHQPEDRQQAETMMKSNCGPDSVVKVAEEGEVAVGQKTNSDANTYKQQQDNNVFTLGGVQFNSGTRPGENTQTSQTTTQLKEWHILYNCQVVKAPEPVRNVSKAAKKK